MDRSPPGNIFCFWSPKIIIIVYTPFPYSFIKGDKSNSNSKLLSLLEYFSIMGFIVVYHLAYVL